jgi:hypothetical protein
LRFSLRRHAPGTHALRGYLSWPFAPLQSLTALAPLPKAKHLAASSLAVSSPSASSRCWAATSLRKEPPFRLRCLLSVSHARKAFIRPTPASHIKAGPAHGVSPSGSILTRGAAVFSNGLAFLRFTSGRFLPQPSVFQSVLGDAQLHSRPSVEATGFPGCASPRLCSPQVPLLGAFFFKSGRKQQTLLGFTSLGESPHPPAGTLGRILSRASTTTSDCPAPALQSLNRGSVGWTLSSLPPLPRFPTFSADPESSH